MQAAEWLINLPVLMSALSIASERVANAMKLRDPDLREKKAGAQAEKARPAYERGPSLEGHTCA